MTGGLIQLVACGAQDVYLTGNPQVTFFKAVYRRHTNFSMESIKQEFMGDSSRDGIATAVVSRYGDLIYKMYLEIEILDDEYIGEAIVSIPALIDYIEINIGGQTIDRQSGEFIQAWNELTHPCGGNMGGNLFQKLIGDVYTNKNLGPRYFPLHFWFCKNAGLALPLIALQYHEVQVKMNHYNYSAYRSTGNPPFVHTIQNSLWIDYIYLDTDERRRFAQVSHEYLIEQVQEQILPYNKKEHILHFNHPVKELIWFSTGRPFRVLDFKKAVVTSPCISLYDIADAKYSLQINGHERFPPRPHTYFSRVQIYQHHSGDGGDNTHYGMSKDTSGVEGNYGFHNIGDVPANNPLTKIYSDRSGYIQDSICVYSFALNPEDHQPSGTCNFSRLDTVKFICNKPIAEEFDEMLINGSRNADEREKTARIVAINYNVLRIMSGMGGLAYSN